MQGDDCGHAFIRAFETPRSWLYCKSCSAAVVIGIRNRRFVNALGACYGVYSLCRNGSLPDFWQYNSNQTYVSFSTQEIKQASSGCKSAWKFTDRPAGFQVLKQAFSWIQWQPIMLARLWDLEQKFINIIYVPWWLMMKFAVFLCKRYGRGIYQYFWKWYSKLWSLSLWLVFEEKPERKNCRMRVFLPFAPLM